MVANSSNSNSRPNNTNLSGNIINNENNKPQIRSLSPTPSSSGSYPIPPAFKVTP